ncbi:penicillin-binding protein activator LpoB [Acerihabitans sp. TG2]|uniref:penicillin-binding protein activator LpoB n=1 Tax=Acerihabitans sp. TG2 TaxID=3096008 RepID=UPI002B23D4D9|nr:penicillin-binding protein activator LpoB [Acerihabitans sp. TG2]MEA9391998.1 penicillin-binding protein activator LpoB [Acerihabitans sp. TG2]
MKKSLFILLATLVLTGCPTRTPEPQQPPATVEPIQTPPPAPPESTPVPMPPKMHTLDWQASVAPLIQQMLGVQGIAPGSVLLINSVKNNTNGSVQTDKATAALYSALDSNHQFTLIGQNQLVLAKQTLGLSVDDSLESRSKAIGLARYVNAQYVLYSDVSGDAKLPELELQLMLVQSGEIIWSGKGLAQE